ncbi:MAG: ABC transporter substrate-binding protein [Tepidanaerobacteraceae bacterium]|nr:ABC transporter substrate-binding protein [Tepidanaerobacteraceae bacterium]
MRKNPLVRLTVLMLVFVLAVSLLLSGCGQKGNQNSSNQNQQNTAPKEKIIRVTVSGTPNLDPGVGQDYGSSTALANIYDSLVFPQNDGTLKPLLAEKWDVGSDNLTYTFYLRKGVKFHNGDELTADDVVFSMKRLLAIGEGFAYLFADVVKDVTAVDQYTVKFTLNKPFGPFVETLVRLYILNKDQVMQNINKNGQYGEMGDYGREWLITHDAGSGPYMVKELKQQGYLYAVRFDDYWGGWDNDAPDAFKLIDTTEGATVRTLMNNRELEITDQWQTTENINAMSKIPGVSICSNFSGTMLNIMLNTKKAPTDDVNFRKALSCVFDYDSIIKLFPDSIQAKGPVPHDLPGFDPEVYQYKQDFEKAKEYLQKSKYADSLDQYPVDLLWVSDVPDEEKIALSFQAAAQQVGIKINIVKAPWISVVDMLSKIESTPNGTIIFVSPHYNEAGSMLESRYHSKSTGTWEQAEWLQNKEIDAMIEDALSTIDKKQRFEKYKKIQNVIVNDITPTIWVLDQAERRAYQSDYVYWPGAELAKQGKPITTIMGYNFYFHDFKIYPEKMKK